MHIPHHLQTLFAAALSDLTEDPQRFAGMIRPTADPKFGDYQSNCAMPLAKQLGGKNPREVAAELIERIDISGLCEPPEIAGPGFINLTLKDSFLTQRLTEMLRDPRCLVSASESPGRIVIDFSSPNVAKPMHVGHIRSTVIGDALARTLRFLGHDVITDNHLGDWGTQFGIIIYGYKHFGDPEVVARDPVPALSELYRLVNRLIVYHKSQALIQPLRERIEELTGELQRARAEVESAEPKQQKKAKKAAAALERRLQASRDQLATAEGTVQTVREDPQLLAQAETHADVGTAVLTETAKLHEGDEENLRLWKQFLPHCQDEINRVYQRLDIHFDHTLGESFYHPMLAGVIAELEQRGLATESDGAICVFLSEFDAPMIVRKQDGAYLYATTDLATLKYRLESFHPDEILYVVDTRQSEHFEKLFAVAGHLSDDSVKLVHVNFGTVLGEDGRPMKTRSGSLIGLEGLLDDAVERARQVVCDPERLARLDPPMDEEEQHRIAEAVGIGAIKFADLSHHRTSDYRFLLDKMVALDGNTSTYVQYSYARTQSILRRAEMSEDDVIAEVQGTGITLAHPAERSLALMLLKLEEALVAVHQDYAPNNLTDYLYETAKAYAIFNDNCPVLKADTEQSRTTRLALVTLCGRVLRTGLSLLGIHAIERM